MSSPVYAMSEAYEAGKIGSYAHDFITVAALGQTNSIETYIPQEVRDKVHEYIDIFYKPINSAVVELLIDGYKDFTLGGFNHPMIWWPIQAPSFHHVIEAQGVQAYVAFLVRFRKKYMDEPKSEHAGVISSEDIWS